MPSLLVTRTYSSQDCSARSRDSSTLMPPNSTKGRLLSTLMSPILIMVVSFGGGRLRLARAMRAGCAGDEGRRQLLARRHFRVTGRTDCRRRAGFQLRVQRGAVIEDEAVAGVMVAADFLEIFENAAFQLVHAVVADVLHVDRRLLAAVAAGAEGGDGLVVQLVLVPGGAVRACAERLEAVG